MKVNIISIVFLALIMVVCFSSCDFFNDDDYIYPEINKTSNTNSTNPSENLSNTVTTNDLIIDSGSIDDDKDSMGADGSADSTDDMLDKETDAPVQSESSYPTHLPPDDLAPDVQKSVLVTFNAAGGESIDSVTVAINSNYALQTPTKRGYKFDGWYNGDAQIAIKGVWIYKDDLTLEAKWSKVDYTITYDLNGGKLQDISPLKETYQISETSVTSLGVPIKDGNTKFMGWQDIATKEIYYDLPKNTIGNFDFKAMWYEYEYTYKTNDGYLLYLKDDNTLAVVGYEGKVKNLIIPREYNGYTINEIGKYAFAGFGVQLTQLNITGFTRCDMYETIIKISEGAFAKCEDLKVQLHQDSYLSVEEWLSILEIENRNDHVSDVIQGMRPAIGWRKYVKG